MSIRIYPPSQLLNKYNHLMKFNCSNIPLPEAHLFALLTGALMHIIKPVHITSVRQPRQAGGLFNLLTGLLLAAWSFASAGESRLDQPQALITRGAYRISRNPMYLAWTFLSSGLALLANSLWMLASIPFGFLYLHFVEIPREEAFLEDMFGDEYQRYQRKVRRYL
jgi:protein-S-isoprenylcysteine O-methyltransferase Ste14